MLNSKYNRYCLALALLCFSSQSLKISTCNAADNGSLSEEKVRAIQGQMKAADHLKTRFTQTIYRSLRNRSTKSEGVAYFSKPNKFRWVLEKPKKVQWVFDGKSLFNYFPTKKLAVQHDSAVSKGRELRQLVNIVINFDELLRSFSIQSAQQDKKNIVINLKPKITNDIQSAQLTLLKKTGFFTSIRLNFAQQNYTLFEFYAPESTRIKDDAYKLPTGTKITNPLAN